MAQVVLPKQIDYRNPASLPEGTQSLSIVSSPVNGSVFTPSTIIQFDLVNRGFLVPESMYIRYKISYTVAVGSATANFVKGTPVYSPFQRLDTIVGSSVIESISGYNQLSNFLVNTKLNYAQKVGLAASFGYSGSGVQYADTFLSTPGNLDFAANAPNGFQIATTTAATTGTASQFLAAPLGCILSNSDRLLPVKYMPSIRIQLSLDSLANVVSNTTNITNFSISNCELVYDCIDFPAMVDQAIMARSGGMVTIKSQSYLSSGVTLPASSVGQLSFLFNQRLASIKSVFTLLSGTASGTCVNTFYDSIDATSGNGEYSWTIAGQNYPQRPLSTVLNKAGILMELSAAFGPISDILSTSFSINPREFNYNSTNVATLATSCQQPGKFWLGTNCERLSTSDALLTGVSSQGSPISFNITLNTAMAANAQIVQLICLYDALLQIDLNARTLVVMQ